MESLILLIIGMTIYYLAYISPKTDKILYGFSGMILLFSAIAGFSSSSYFPIGEDVQYTYDAQDKLISEQKTTTYSDSRLATNALPIVSLLMGLYILIALGVDSNIENGRSSKSKDRK